MSDVSRLRLTIRGTVQGVGFRPFVYRLARRYGLAGSVRNTAQGVVVEIEGRSTEDFVTACRSEAPPLAVIDHIAIDTVPVAGECGFVVMASRDGADGALVPPDVGPCPACMAEVFDPANRRHLYPFTTCTDCGPRLTIVEQLPYDRPRTTMRDFPLCPDCAAEYADPSSRRFHAEAIACPHCGPVLSHSIAAMAEAVAAGKIVALKGLGGFHLACDAADDAAVDRLRRRKGRDAKPFAVMVADLAAARRHAALTPVEEALLESRERPIVIVTAAHTALAPTVSSGLPTVGLMLPSSMLHVLFLHEAARRGSSALVMTSGNLAGDPVLIDDGAARKRLGVVADLVVTHNRRIAARADDTVMRVVADAPRFVRRSRGTVPIPIDLASDGPDVLALGGDLKVTACVMKGKRAQLSAHVGDLASPQAVTALEEAVTRLLSLTGAKPVAIAHDLHPDFASTRLAQRLAQSWGCQLVPVQHHHAHAAAVAAEYGLTHCVAIALDGFGLGPADCAVRAWGGEVLLHRGAGFERLGTLAPLLEPGGDLAAREPWRMAQAVLVGQGRPPRFEHRPQAAALARLIASGAITEKTSSAGRVFDAAAALLGICEVNRFEAEAAMRLEALAGSPAVLPGGFEIRGAELDFAPLLDHLGSGCDPARGAALVHGTMAEGFAALVAEVAKPDWPVVLCGGCFLNRVLAAALRDRLNQFGFAVYMARQAPCNDGGLALGQAAVARAVMMG